MMVCAVNTPSKICPRCKQEFPLTSEYWHKDRAAKDGFYPWCKSCKCEVKRQRYDPEKARLYRIDHADYAAQYREEHKEELKAYSHERYLKNKDKHAALSRKWALENKEKVRKSGREYQRRRRANDPESCRQYNRKIYWENPERYREMARIYAMNNRDKLRAATKKYRANNPHRNRDWRRANPELAVLHNHRRRARKAQAPGSYTGQDARNIYRFQNGRCKYCNANLEETGKHLDHIIPLSRGGSNWPTNLQYLCPHCNCTKHDKMPWEFKPEWYFN